MTLVISTIIFILLLLWVLKLIMNIDHYYINSFGVFLWDYFPAFCVMSVALMAGSVALSEIQRYLSI